MTSGATWHERHRTFAISIVQTLQKLGFTAYFAGGCVRDRLLSLTPTDYDVATNAAPEQIIQIFGRKNTLMVGAAFGVVCVHRRIEGDIFNVEVATFRSDGEYLDGRRPASVRYATPEHDAQRRDFTINGLFYDPVADATHDFIGGQKDLQAGIVRAIGDAHQRITEDKLRMIRAIRFAARFQFELDHETYAAIEAHACELDAVSAERVADELEKICKLNMAAWAWRMLHSTGLLLKIWQPLAELWSRDDGIKQASLHIVEEVYAQGFEGIMGALSYQLSLATHVESKAVVRDIVQRLKLSNEQARNIGYIAGNVDAFIDCQHTKWSELQPLVIQPAFKWAVEVADAIARYEQRTLGGIERLRFVQTLPLSQCDPPPLLDGRDLQKIGMQPGPRFKSVLQQIRCLQLDGHLTSADEAVAWIKSNGDS